MKFRITADITVNTSPKIEPDDLMSSVEATFESLFDDDYVVNDLIDSVDGFADREVKDVSVDVISVQVSVL